LQPKFKAYGEQVIKNAQTMAKAFVEKGYNLVSDGTDNHLMLIDLRNKNISGKKAEQTLVQADITVNKNMVPFDDKSPFVTSGIRIGTPSVTTRGMKEKDMLQIVEWIDGLINNADDEAFILKTKKEVNAYMSNFPLYE
jgi:glycine hydroxymethyltransferase